AELIHRADSDIPLAMMYALMRRSTRSTCHDVQRPLPRAATQTAESQSSKQRERANLGREVIHRTAVSTASASNTLMWLPFANHGAEMHLRQRRLVNGFCISSRSISGSLHPGVKRAR